MAFPTTSVIDDFNRADANPATGWTTTPIFSGDGGVQTLGNQLANVGATWCSRIYNSTSTTFGPDSEAYGTIAASAGTGEAIELFIRIQNPNTASVSNYFAHFDQGGNSLQLWKTVNNTQTQLGSSVSITEAVGDSFGVEAIGSAIKAYYKTSGGSWTQQISQTDSGVSGSGCLGVSMESNGSRLDDFGGGTVVTGGGMTAGEMAAAQQLGQKQPVLEKTEIVGYQLAA